jgi:hypothetical protein
MGMLGSRVGWAFVVVHWGLYAAALWMRGGPGKWISVEREPVLMNVLVFVDLACWFLVSLVFRGWEYLAAADTYDHPEYWYITAGLLAGIQWYWIGNGLERRWESRKLK